MKLLCLSIAAVGVAAGSSGLAQTQAQQSRADQLAEFFVIAPMCEHLGMTLEADFQTKARLTIADEMAAWKVPASVADQMMIGALARQGAIFRTDTEADSGAARTDAQLKGIRSIFVRYGRKCVSASVDHTFSKLIHQPPGYDLEESATTAADALLEIGGLASWQTPAIQARGDLMAIAGTCRSKIGPARSDAIVREYGNSEDARARAYYLRAFDGGLADQTTIATLAGCNRAIARLRAKAGSGVSAGYSTGHRPQP